MNLRTRSSNTNLSKTTSYWVKYDPRASIRGPPCSAGPDRALDLKPWKDKEIFYSNTSFFITHEFSGYFGQQPCFLFLMHFWSTSAILWNLINTGPLIVIRVHFLEELEVAVWECFATTHTCDHDTQLPITQDWIFTYKFQTERVLEVTQACDSQRPGNYSPFWDSDKRCQPSLFPNYINYNLRPVVVRRLNPTLFDRWGKSGSEK